MGKQKADSNEESVSFEVSLGTHKKCMPTFSAKFKHKHTEISLFELYQLFCVLFRSLLGMNVNFKSLKIYENVQMGPFRKISIV